MCRSDFRDDSPLCIINGALENPFNFRENICNDLNEVKRFELSDKASLKHKLDIPQFNLKRKRGIRNKKPKTIIDKGRKKFSIHKSQLRSNAIIKLESKSNIFPTVSASMLNSILNKTVPIPQYESLLLIDARFEYEYEGGHIIDSININSVADVIEQLFNKNKNTLPTLLVIYCEFSECRGPRLASQIRRYDRQINWDNYPLLVYPDILILEGGYNAFFNKFKCICYPKNYIPMTYSNNLVFSEMYIDIFKKESSFLLGNKKSGIIKVENSLKDQDSDHCSTPTPCN